MVKRTSEEEKEDENYPKLSQGVRILIIQSRYYKDIAGILLSKAEAALQQNKCSYDEICVEGALEIPQALAAAVKTNVFGPTKRRYQGAIALGCIVRGQTSHYDIVCQNANFWLMNIALMHGVPLGNGILTVDTLEQARDRALGSHGTSKGEDAVRACLGLIELKRKLGRISLKKSKQ